MRSHLFAEMNGTHNIDGTTAKRCDLTLPVLELSALVPPSSKHGVCRDGRSQEASPVFSGTDRQTFLVQI